MTKHDDMNTEMEENEFEFDDAEGSPPKQDEQISEVEVLKNENASLSLKYLETLAELQNVKKRNAQEYEVLQKFRSQRLILELLPILDSFELAINAGKNNKSTEVNNFLKGFELLFNQVNQVLNQEGIEFIDAQGEKFNPQLHEAVALVDDENYENDVIVEQLQKGYVLKDRVLRPALVKVNKNDK